MTDKGADSWLCRCHWAADRKGGSFKPWGEIRSLTSFFFCLEPSLYTRTTAVLKTGKKVKKKSSYGKESLGFSPKLQYPVVINTGYEETAEPRPQLPLHLPLTRHACETQQPTEGKFPRFRINTDAQNLIGLKSRNYMNNSWTMNRVKSSMLQNSERIY